MSAAASKIRRHKAQKSGVSQIRMFPAKNTRISIRGQAWQSAWVICFLEESNNIPPVRECCHFLLWTFFLSYQKTCSHFKDEKNLVHVARRLYSSVFYLYRVSKCYLSTAPFPTYHQPPLQINYRVIVAGFTLEHWKTALICLGSINWLAPDYPRIKKIGSWG